MKILEYTLRFDTPAFLGNAEQNAQWRTPPIKALLRQWWRVAYAEEKGFKVDPATMRREEGLLFGNAWLENDYCKSRVRLRLERWDTGRLTQWPGPEATVHHPEVGAHGANVGSTLYLGYGPLRFQGGHTTLKANAAIQHGESATLSVAMPEPDAPQIERALWLMNQFGALGGRSRNGWGSFSLLPLPAGEASPERSQGGWGEGELPLRPWRDCLQCDWPHAIGADESGALIWQTEAFTDWKALMQRLAAIKIGLRTQKSFAFTTGKNATNTEARHWLSYPVTNHSVKAWGNNARLPNTLRFKVRSTHDGKLVGVIFHVPHSPPPQFQPDQKAIAAVWRTVHGWLDNWQDNQGRKLTRIAK